MTTTTSSKPSAAERERELEQALAEAQAERDAIRQRAREHRSRIEQLEAELQQRAVSHPGEWGDTGVPRPRSPAGKIAAEIKQLISEDSFDALIAGAQGRVELAEQALRDHRAERSRDLLAELEPAAREAVDRWLEWAAEGQQHHRELVEIAARATHVVVSARLYRGDGRTVPDYDHQGQTLRMAEQPPPLPLPRPFLEELAAKREAGDG